MYRAPVTLLTLVAVAIPTAATAKTLTNRNIVSPSKQLRCHALKIGGPGIECNGSFLPNFQPKLDLNPYVQVKTHGLSIYGERRDDTGYGGASRTLGYGDTWKWRGVTCKLTRTSMTCKNQDRHGVTLTRHKMKRF